MTRRNRSAAAAAALLAAAAGLVSVGACALAQNGGGGAAAGTGPAANARQRLLDEAKSLPPASVKPDADGKVRLSNAAWKKLLPADVYDVTREAGTEPAFSHPYADLHDKGTFVCADCGLPLFASGTKFDSGTGWPSFWQPIKKGAVNEREDRSYGMVRTEVRCSRCGAHLGHVFDDGPKPTGLRYCMNGLALKFVPAAPAAPAPAPAKR